MPALIEIATIQVDLTVAALPNVAVIEVATRGLSGLSAYQVALVNGYVGTEAQWLASLQGVDGRSAYQVAVDNGFVGTVQDWLDSLQGEDGDTTAADAAAAAAQASADASATSASNAAASAAAAAADADAALVVAADQEYLDSLFWIGGG